MAAVPAHVGFGNVFDHRMKECANCLVFNWKSEGATLQQCSRCKVLVYCDKQCQEEHWYLVHKHHCKKLAEAKAEEERTNPELKQSSVGIFSHHPFPREGLAEDIHERLILTVGRIIDEMRSTQHKAYSILKSEIDVLERGVYSAQRRIWSSRKVYPKELSNYAGQELLHSFNDFINDNQSFYFNAKRGRYAKLDLWGTLLLFVDEIVNMASQQTPQFKGFEVSKERSSFLRRVELLVEAGSRTNFPNFSSFLEILCGGNLIQKCTFCHIPTTIQALAWNGKGCDRLRYSTLVAKPNNPLVFCCHRQSCVQRLDEIAFGIIEKAFCWDQVLERGSAMRCDNCFKLSSRVHR